MSSLGLEHPLFLRLFFILAMASLVEFVTIRVFSRMGILLPKDPLVFALYNFTIFLGSAVFNLASVLVFVTLAVAVVLTTPRNGWKNLTLINAVVLLLVFSAALLVLSPDPILSLSYDVLAGAIISSVVIRAALHSQRIWTRLMFALIGAAYLSTYYFKIAPLAEQILSIGQDPGITLAVFNLGEGLAVLASFAILATFGLEEKPSSLGSVLRSKAAFGATLAVIVFALSYVRNPWTTSILTTWTVGFTLYLPLPLYLGAIWAFTYSLVRSWSRDRLLFSSLLLMLLGGRMLQLTYLTLLAIIGLLVISGISSMLQRVIVEPVRELTVEARRPVLRRV